MGDPVENHAPTPASAPAPRRVASTNRSWWLLGTVVLVTLACIRFPQVTFSPQSLDNSWQAVLIHAREARLQFGRDIVFTYGPLGFLSIECFAPGVAVARLFCEIACGVLIAFGLCLLAWRMQLTWRIVLLGYFLLIASPIHWDGDALYLDLGLFAWGILCYVESGRRLRTFAAALVVAAVLGALVKFTFLVTGAFTIGLLACELTFRGRRALAAGMVTGFALAFVLGWMCLGQSLSGFGRYVATSFAVTSGYNATMGVDRANLAPVLLTVLAALVAVVIRAITRPLPPAGASALRRLPLLVWLAGLLFEQWKYACVRNDWDHVAMMLGVVPVMAIGMEALGTTGAKWMRISRAATIACLAGAFLFLMSAGGAMMPVKCVKHAGLNLADTVRILAWPHEYLRAQTETLRAEQARGQLPRIRSAVGGAAVEIFGRNQSLALLNELNYRPRPVFQSYAACSRDMTRLNEEFLQSGNAPEYVLFNLDPVDNRFAPLEDSLVFRDCLTGGELVLSEGGNLLLHRKPATNAPMTLVKEGSARAGEKIDLPGPPDALLWLEIDVESGLTDRLRGFLYKPRETGLVIWSATNSVPPASYNAPAEMLSAGFLVNPLLPDNQAVQNFLTGAGNQHAAAVSVQVASSWLNSSPPVIRFRVYRVDARPN